MRRIPFIALLLLCIAQPSRADEPVVVVANLAFHSAFWPNLHHALYGSAWARRPKTGARRLMPDLPAPLTEKLSSEERAAWDAAVEYYDRNLADRDLLTGMGMARIKMALAAEDLASDAIGPELRSVLEGVAPIYRQRLWAAHDRSNREWIQATVDRLRMIENEIVSAQARMYGRPWFAAPVRVDIVWIGRAYTSLFPTLATVSPAEGPLTGWTSVEMVLHEVSHELILPIQQDLAAAFGDRWKQHGVLWHVVQFYMTGLALERILASRGIEYRKYLDSEGLFDRAWPQYRKPIEESWAPYVRGEISRAEAIMRTVAAVADSAQTNIAATPRVQTTLGPVEGRLDGAVSAFTGIPYAEPPVGTRRFRAPEPKRPWTAVFDATKPGPLCPQIRMSGAVAGSEDCLTVNVWSPLNAKGLPVMVFFHGGRHMVGGALGGQISFDGARLAEEARVVVFSVEFRFGALGYLTHPALDAEAGSGRSGNYGMLDQLLGLQWVRANARAFGGEAERVTVFGQSSGSTDIALLLVAPRARGLFHRAILDSVPVGAAVGSRARALEVGQKAAQAAGCNGPEAASCLRTVSMEQLLKSAANPRLLFAPHVDGALFPVAPLEAFATGAYAHMPILLGTARDEQAYFLPDVSDAERYAAMMRQEFPKVAEQALALYPVSKYGTPKAAYIAAMSDADFTCPTRRLARTLSKAQSEPVYRYLFTHGMERGPDAQLGAFHILSQFFLFGRYETYPYEPSDPERALSKLLQGYWGRFTSGNPNGSGTAKWEPYEPSRDPVMLLDLHPVLAGDLRPDECDFWDRSGS